jgi:GNAT superfamily N-acetyltransferase
VAESDKALVGFAAADLATSSVWALFVEPGSEGKGVGRALQERLLVWAREQEIEKLYLSTAADSRAATFYAQSGWIEAGVTENGEIRFELPVRR